MEVKAKWTGRGFALCIGEWKLYVDGKDVTDKIPEDLRTEPMIHIKDMSDGILRTGLKNGNHIMTD